jgi:glucan 1,3-beta-glucosidase
MANIICADSTFSNGFYGVGIQPLNGAEAPELLLDNVAVSKMPILVGEVGGGEKKTYMEGSDSEDKKTVKSWAMGTRYTSRSGKGEVTHGLVTPAPDKPSKLLDKDGKYFVRSKPGYEDIKASDWIVVTRMGIANDGTGDQTDAINKLFRSNLKMPLYFPAGIYQVKGTINIPAGIKIAGSGWSNIRGTGSFFGDTNNPKPMVRVGKPGDEGVVEISDMLFTVKGATAGAILMEWNVKETSQGSAAMWDSHFRIGGAAGTDLSLADCPQAGGLQEKCMAASMLLHVTEQASGYFENIWAWTADQ